MFLLLHFAFLKSTRLEKENSIDHKQQHVISLFFRSAFLSGLLSLLPTILLKGCVHGFRQLDLLDLKRFYAIDCCSVTDIKLVIDGHSTQREASPTCPWPWVSVAPVAVAVAEPPVAVPSAAAPAPAPAAAPVQVAEAAEAARAGPVAPELLPAAFTGLLASWVIGQPAGHATGPAAHRSAAAGTADAPGPGGVAPRSLRRDALKR